MIHNNNLNLAIQKLSHFIDIHEIGDEYDYVDLFQLNEIYNTLCEATKEQFDELIVHAIDYWIKENKDSIYYSLSKKDKKEIADIIGKSEKTVYRKIKDHCFDNEEIEMIKEYYGLYSKDYE